MSTGADNNVVSRASVAIVGGGFSGTTLAAQLLRRTGPSFSVIVVEKTSSVGRGLAYGKQSRSLLLNVRARNMSAFADDPDLKDAMARAGVSGPPRIEISVEV